MMRSGNCTTPSLLVILAKPSWSEESSLRFAAIDFFYAILLAADRTPASGAGRASFSR
jgi:hypothetical protein